MRTLFTWMMAAATSLVAPATAAFAADKPVLTIYTYESFTSEWGPGPAIEADVHIKANPMADLKKELAAFELVEGEDALAL